MVKQGGFVACVSCRILYVYICYGVLLKHVPCDVCTSLRKVLQYGGRETDRSASSVIPAKQAVLPQQLTSVQ